MKIVPSDGAAFKTFTTLNISLRLDLVKLYKTEDEEIKFLFEGQIQKPQEELPSGGENAKSWKTKIFQGADFDQIQLGCQTKLISQTIKQSSLVGTKEILFPK